MSSKCLPSVIPNVTSKNHNCNPFQSSLSLSIHVSCCIHCVICTFFSCFYQLFLCFTQFGGGPHCLNFDKFCVVGKQNNESVSPSLTYVIPCSSFPRFTCKESRGDLGRVMVILYVWCVFVCPLQSSTLMRYMQMKRKKQQQRYLHYFKKQKPQTSFYESPRSLRWCGDLRAEERNGNRR